jgi:methyl-accepting chemotaxis protein
MITTPLFGVIHMNQFRGIGNLRVGARLGLAFGLVLLITALIGMLGVWSLGSLKNASVEVGTGDLERTVLSQRMATNIELNYSRTFAAFGTTDDGYITELRTGIDKSAKNLTEIEARLLTLIKEEKSKQLLEAMSKQLAQYTVLSSDLLKRKLAGEYVVNDAKDTLKPMALGMLAAVQAFDEHLTSRLVSSQADTVALANRSQLTLGVGATVAVVLGILFALMATRSITRPLQSAAATASAIANGDLASPVPESGTDEAGQMLISLSNMQSNLASIVQKVRQNAQLVSSASAEIAQGNQDLSDRTERQANALQQTTTSMAELSATVSQNADSARQANQLAMSASSVAIQGGEMVGQVVETMKGISDSSKKIADIIGVIDGIAFQTNILALNAAVEAARAGEQGRGFAVVASEVRSLAGRSADAAKEIKTLIQASVQRVEQGGLQVNRAGATMKEVVASIQRVTDLVGEISAASSEQSSGVAQVGQAITQMDQTTQQNAALVEEMAAAASSLNAQARELVHTVAVFQLGNEMPASAPDVPQRKAIKGQPGQSIPENRRLG